MNDELLLLIPKMRPVEFAGLAKLLGVALTEQKEGEKDTPRNFIDVLEDVLKKFQSKNKKQRREILKLIKKSVCIGDHSAGNSKNSQSTSND